MSDPQPLNTSKFELAIEGMNVKQVSAITGLGMSTEALPVQEGTMRSKTSKKGRTKCRPIRITRLFTADKSFVKWFTDCAHREPEKKSGSIILKNDDHKEIMRFNFTSAWPIGWDGPNFDVNASPSLAEETMTLDIDQIEVA